MKNIRKGLILLLTFLVMFTVGCGKSTEQVASSSNYKKLTGKLISQGIFQTKYTKGYCPAGSMGIMLDAGIYSKGKSIEFLNDKDIIIANLKLKYEWTDSEKISITNPTNNATTVYKFSYNNGVFRLYPNENVYVDFIKEGTAYTPEKTSVEDLKHPAIDDAEKFLEIVSLITGTEKNNAYSLNIYENYISPKLKEQLIGPVSDKKTENNNPKVKERVKTVGEEEEVSEDDKIRQALGPLAKSIRELNMKDFASNSEYAIKEKSDNKVVMEVYANDKLFKTLDLELIDSKWKIAAIN